VFLPPERDDKVGHEFQLFDARSGEQLWSRDDYTTMPSYGIKTRTWSPNGNLIALSRVYSDGKAAIEIWDAATGKTLAKLARPDDAPTTDPNMMFSPDSRMLAQGDFHKILVWDLPEVSDETEQPIEVVAPSLTLANPHAPLRALCFSEGGREIRAISSDAITTWDATLREPIETSQSLGTRAAQFSPDATRLAVGQRNGEVTIWDTTTRQLVSRIPYDHPISLPAQNLVFSPDGRQLVIHRFRPISRPELGQQEEGYWEFWLHSVDDGRLLAHFDITSLDRLSRIPKVRFRHDGGQMALAHQSRLEPDRPTQLRVWDLKKYVELSPAELPQRDVWLLGYSADGAQLIIASRVSDSVRVATLDAATRSVQSTRVFPGDGGFRFDATQNRLAVRDKTDVVFYDLDTGNERWRLRGFDGLWSAWSPDGRRLAAQEVGRETSPSKIVLWSLESGRRLITLDGPVWLSAIAFSGDGHRLLARSRSWPGDHPSQIWDATPLSDTE
jgi:WD40 repeat protein